MNDEQNERLHIITTGKRFEKKTFKFNFLACASRDEQTLQTYKLTMYQSFLLS